MAGIYKIENLINHKIYIGSTNSKFNRRWNCHKSMLRRNLHKNKHLQNAWNKYGESNFKFEVLEDITNPNRNELIQKEKSYKDLFNAEYNLAPIDRPLGIINVGRKHTDKTKEKMRKSHKNHKMPSWFGKFISETRSGINNPNYGKSPSIATKNKISIANKGKKKPQFTEEHKKNLSLSHIGKNKGINNPSVKCRYKFYHPQYGEEILAQCELRVKYRLKQSKLPLICNGTRKSYKGWICIGKV